MGLEDFIMSLGGLAGAVVGGAIGFFVGGPVGAAIGAGLGAGLGLILDPVEPDAPTPGDPGSVTVNTAKEGSPIPDALGTVKLNANIIWSCCERSVEVTSEVEGGKGGSQTQEVSQGFEYFLSWAVAICKGPITRLYTIYANDKIVWHGDLEPPASGGMITLSLDGMGACDFYFGTDDQAPNDYVGARISDSTLNPGYRGLCYAVLKDNSLGSYNRAPSLFFVVEKNPSFPALSNEYFPIESFDYNPAYAAYYILNKMTGLSSDYLDPDDFDEAARKLWGEARGLSIGFTRAQDALTYIESILIHVSAGLRWSGQSRLHFFLFRESVDPDSLPEFIPDQMLSEPRLDRNSWLATENEVKVQYSKRIFRERICPTGCDGFQMLNPPAILGDNETFQMQISNPDWNVGQFETCDDLSFLSDGLPEEKRGTFYGLTRQTEGTWSFSYTSSESLCDGQDDPADDCPTICGVRVACCNCDVREPVEIDPNNAVTIADNSQRTVRWLKGSGLLFKVTVTGTDAWLDSAKTLTSIEVVGRETQIYTGPSAAGAIFFEIEDLTCPSANVISYLRAPGSWNNCCSWLQGGCCGAGCTNVTQVYIDQSVSPAALIRRITGCSPSGVSGLCPTTFNINPCGSTPNDCGTSVTWSVVSAGCANTKIGEGSAAQWIP